MQTFVDGFNRFTPEGVDPMTLMTYISLMRRHLLFDRPDVHMDREGASSRPVTLLGDQLDVDGLPVAQYLSVRTGFQEGVLVPRYWTKVWTHQPGDKVPVMGSGQSWHVRAQIPLKMDVEL
jgi:hypothetical protein